MISFKQFILEKAMNRTVFSKTLDALGNKAKLGFEVEVFIPGTSSLASPNKQRDSEKIRRYDTLDEFEEYFEISRYERYSIEGDFTNWVEAQKEQFIDDNYEQHMDDDTDEDAARTIAAADFKDLNWTNWFHEEFRDANAFVQNYSLHPKYGWAEEGVSVYTQGTSNDDFVWKEVAKEVAYYLERSLRQKVHVNGDTSSEWSIVQDSSIEGATRNDVGVGVEIVSPPQDAHTALGDLETVFQFIDRHDLVTNASTGLHVNLSLPDMNKVDPLKLVLFMGEKFALGQFKNRLGNSMTKSQIDGILSRLQSTGTLPNSARDLTQMARDSLAKSKYHTVNLGKLDEGYLEFRVAGGADYHKAIDTVKEQVGRWLTVMDIASDPEKEKNEYYKKVVKLFGKTASAKSKDDASKLSLEDYLYMGNASMAGGEWGRFVKYVGGSDRGLALASLVELLSWDLYFAIQKLGAPSPKQIAELKVILKKAGITSAQLKALLADADVPIEASKAAEAFNL